MADNALEVLVRVKATSSVSSLGSAIAHAVYDGKEVTLRAIGAAAVNVSIKAVIVARGFTAMRGIDLSCRPGFITIDIDGEETTAIILRVDAE